MKREATPVTVEDVEDIYDDQMDSFGVVEEGLERSGPPTPPVDLRSILMEIRDAVQETCQDKASLVATAVTGITRQILNMNKELS
jgi:hypothetical protein